MGLAVWPSAAEIQWHQHHPAATAHGPFINGFDLQNKTYTK